MKFLFPTFLFALFAILIPILIHLFSFKRYKTIYFSNVNFLKGIKKESKKKTRLKQLLLLAARILTLFFLILAFAQPYIPTNKNTKSQAKQLVGIYIDNSFSMNALSTEGQLLETARNKALEICLAYPTGTKFRLFTNDQKAKHQHLYNKEQFIQEISEIKASPSVIPMSLLHSTFAEITEEEVAEKANKNLYFISDFQRTISDLENFSETDIFTYYLPLVPNEITNLYIDSCWVEVPAHRLGEEENMFVRIKNSSKKDYQNLPLKLSFNDSIKSITSFSVDAKGEIIAQLKYTNNSSGPQLGKIEITDYPFTHDNNWYISYFVEKNLKALAIYGAGKDSKDGLKHLQALFSNDSYIQLDQMSVKSLQVNQLKEYNTIFLLNLQNFSSGFLNALENATKNGTSVVLFPHMSNNFVQNNKLLSRFTANIITGIDSTKQKIAKIDFKNRFYKNVFRKIENNPILPEVKGHFRFKQTTRNTETKLLAFQNGDKALALQNYNDGKLWAFSFPLNSNNNTFTRDILFVPSIYNIVLNSLPKQSISFTVGKNTFFDLPRNLNINLESSLEIENPISKEKFIPSKTISERSTRISFQDQIRNDGHYLISNNGEIISSMAFNFNRLESDLRYLQVAELEEKLENTQQKNATVIADINQNFSEILENIQHGKQLWRWCILLALLFIVAEVLISRFWK